MNPQKRCFILFSTIFMFLTSLVSGTIHQEKARAADTDTYYTSDYSIDVTGQSGDTLLQSLKTITTSSHKKATSYEDCKTYPVYCDADPSQSGNIILFYSGASISGTWDSGDSWNREHVWPQSKSGGLYSTSGAGSDLHHIRPTAPKVNELRGNLPFGEVASYSGTVEEMVYNGQGIGCYRIEGKVFEPRDGVKGDVARILMYLYTRYYDAGTLVITNVVTTPSNSASAAWSLLLDWNEIDPVDELEINRNNYLYTLQGNRNPYIDHAEFAEMIFDSSYNGPGALQTQDSTGTSVPVTGITLNPTSLSLAAGASQTLTATVLPTNATNRSITWSTSNASVATVSGGTVRGIGEGGATITASCGGFSATASITVTGAKYQQLSSINDIDSNGRYVLGRDTNGFHYAGTSGWGSISLPETNEPFYYTLSVISASDSTFSASTIVDGTTKYLTVPENSNTFEMVNTVTTLKLGGAQNDASTVGSPTTLTRHLRINGTNGIRSYTSTTGTIAYFYLVAEESTHDPQTLADAFLARLTSLVGQVSRDDEATIMAIQNDYASLDSDVKALVDNGGYASLMSELEAELLAIYQAEADQVIALIAALPEAATIDSTNYMLYQASISAAKAAYDALSSASQALVTNYAKLNLLLSRLASINPEWVLITDSTFLNGATLPTGWTGVGASVFATTRMALRTAGNYLSYDLGVEKTSKVQVQVYSATNNATAINTITVYGLDSAGEVVSSQTFEPLSQSVSNATAIDNACSEANSRTVTLDGNISTVKVELTTRNANWVVREVKISYQNAGISVLDALIELMNSLSTCDDYARAPEVRAVYQNSLTASEQAIFDETICQEDQNCTMATKLAYMEYLLALESQSKVPAARNLISDFSSMSGVMMVLAVGLMGLVTVAGYYYYFNKKRVQK